MKITNKLKLSIREELVYYVVRIKQNSLMSIDDTSHKINLEKFWNQEKETLIQLYSLFSQICIMSCSSKATNKSFSIDGYIHRKQKTALYSKKLCYSKILDEFN
jgi:hypothetical protein